MSQIASQGIAPKDVRKEIDRIRREAAEQFVDERSSSEAPANMRATLSNLVIVVCEPCEKNTSAQIDEVIATLAVQHPSRFFIIRCRQSEETELQVSVSSRCVQARSGTGICTEEVLLRVSPQTADVVPNLLLSLLVPDIETVLLLLNDKQDLADNGFAGLVDTLGSRVDVLMYDSAVFGEYQHGIESILSLLAQEPESGFQGAIARDVAWLRVKRWQELIVEQFNAQQFVSTPGAVTQIKLTQYSCSGSDGRGQSLPTVLFPEAVLLLAWCFDCLGWTVERLISSLDGVLRIACVTPDEQQTEIVVATASDATKVMIGDRIKSIAISAGAGDGEMQVSIERDPHHAQAKVAVSVTADGSGSQQSCDYSARKIPFVTPSYSEIISSRIGTQRIHTQRERCITLARNLAKVAAGVSK